MRAALPLTAVGLAVAAAVLSTPAFAQEDADRATARALGQDGQAAIDAKDYKRAEDDFRRADSLVHAPTLLLGLARALVGEGKFVAAQEAYQRIIREGVAPGAPEVFTRALDAAKTEVKDVAPKIGGMTIRVQATGGGAVPSVKVTLDDAPLSAASLGIRRLVDPGAHVVKATADGFKPGELKVTVPEGGSAEAPLSLDKDTGAGAAPPPVAPVTPPPDQQQPAQPAPDQAQSSGGKSILPWVAFGVGGVGLGLGVVTGVLALGKHSTLSSECGGGSCPPSAQSDLDGYHTMGILSTVGFIVAGVGAAAGVTLLFVLPKGDSAPASAGLQVQPVVGPGSIGATGRF